MDELPVIKVQERAFRELADELYSLVRDSFFALKNRHEVDVSLFYRVDRLLPMEADYKLLKAIYDQIATSYRILFRGRPPLPFETSQQICADYRKESWKVYYRAEVRALTVEPSFTRAVIEVMTEHDPALKSAALDTISRFLEQRYAYLTHASPA